MENLRIPSHFSFQPVFARVCYETPMFRHKSTSLLICYTSIKPHIDHLRIYVDAHPCTGAIRWPTLNGAATLLSGIKLLCLVMLTLLLSEKMKHEFSFS